MKFSAIPSFTALAALVAPFVNATPLREIPASGNVERRVNTAGPHWVAYWDAWLSGENGPPATSVVNGYNTLILAFLLATGTADQAQEWTLIDAGTRSSTKAAYSAAGINLMVSAFGSTENPTSSGFDAAGTANTMASWVKTYGLDGIDVDYEDFGAMNKQDGSAENWLATFTTTLRSALPSGQYIITHAPVAPWFSPIYTSGAYIKVQSSVGSIIDWYNVQFYNQGTTEYTTCAGLLTASSSSWPKSSVFQINSNAGVPLSKIVIGKPGTTADANNGYIDASTLAGCVSQAKSSGWNGGVMVWQFPHADSAWITTVRASSWPVGSTSNPTTTSKATTTTTKATSATSAPATTTSKSSGSGSCAGVAAWSSTTAYNGGSTVTYSASSYSKILCEECSLTTFDIIDGSLWTNSYWSYNDVPGGSAGVWVKGATC
ncbi:glycoside hydrolase [Clavulina sp. PMI_390]|nr:glycoside hydrolase [Clavulina sp. PMI_390]